MSDDDSPTPAPSGSTGRTGMGRTTREQVAALEAAETIRIAAHDSEVAAEQSRAAAEVVLQLADDAPGQRRRTEQTQGSHRMGSRPLPQRLLTTLPLHRRTPLGIGFMFTIGALAAVLLAQVALAAQAVLIIIVVAMFIALGLNPLVATLNRLGIPRGLAVVIVVLLGFGLVGLAVWSLVPVVTRQMTLLITNGPQLLEQTRNNPMINDLDARFQIIARSTEFLTSPNLANQLFGGFLGASQLVISALVSGITLTALTIYFLASLPMIKKAVYRLSPASRRDRMRYLADEMFERIGAYLSGLFVIVTLAGIGTFIMLTVNGLGEYALALAVVVLILDFIPLVGPTIGMVIVSTIAFVTSPQQGVIALIYYLVYTQLEAYVIYPRVMSRSVDVPGVITITAALLGGTLLGIVGALLAVPTAAVILLLWREVLQPRLDAT